jgi:hypothetical protein
VTLLCSKVVSLLQCRRKKWCHQFVHLRKLLSICLTRPRSTWDTDHQSGLSQVCSSHTSCCKNKQQWADWIYCTNTHCANLPTLTYKRVTWPASTTVSPWFCKLWLKGPQAAHCFNTAQCDHNYIISISINLEILCAKIQHSFMFT